MIDKELQQNDSKYLKEAYDLTDNKWNHLTIEDLYRAILYTLEKNGYINKARWRSVESINPDRQLEVIHLLLLVNLLEEDTLINFVTEMHYFVPNTNKSIQPLYNPYEENDEILLLELNSGYLELHKQDLLYKPSTEV